MQADTILQNKKPESGHPILAFLISIIMRVSFP